MEARSVPNAQSYEEWRLELVLPADGKTGRVVQALRERMPEGVDVHRNGRRAIRLYAPSRQAIAEAETVATEVLAEHRLRTAPDLRRWNPGQERWQSPFLPVDAPRAALPHTWSGLDESAWEIRLRFRHDWERAQLEDELLDRGAAVIGDGACRLLVAEATEGLARLRAEELERASRPLEVECARSPAGGVGCCGRGSPETMPPWISAARGAPDWVTATTRATGAMEAVTAEGWRRRRLTRRPSGSKPYFLRLTVLPAPLAAARRAG